MKVYSSQIAFEQLAASVSAHPQATALRSLAVIGAAGGVGATTVAMNLARTMTAGNKTVLLISLKKSPPGGSGPAITKASGILSLAGQMEGNFYYAEVPASHFLQIVPGSDAALARMTQDLAEKYDVVIWDLMPIDAAPNSAAICKHTEGVVLVLHAGKTRWHSAKHTINALKFSGANILGVVLNKKKVYIPRWIYRLLFRYAS